MEEDFRALIMADAGVAAIGPSVVFGERPQGSGYPAIVCHTIGRIYPLTLASHDGVQDCTIQCDCMDVKHLDALGLSRALVAAVAGHVGTYGTTRFQAVLAESSNDFSGQPGTTDQVHRVIVEFRVLFTGA